MVNAHPQPPHRLPELVKVNEAGLGVNPVGQRLKIDGPELTRKEIKMTQTRFGDLQSLVSNQTIGDVQNHRIHRSQAQDVALIFFLAV